MSELILALDYAAAWKSRALAAEKERDVAEAKVARMREALRPFAERAERYELYADSSCLDVDGGPRATGDCLHVAQLRAARAAMAEEST